MTVIKKEVDVRPYLAELIGTFFFVFLGAGSILMSAYAGFSGGAALIQVAAAHGFAIAVMVAATGAISGGHLNPAVTFAFFLRGKMGWGKTAGYIVMQLAGALLAAVFLKEIALMLEKSGAADPLAIAAVNLGTPALGAGIPLAAGFVVEVILTAALVFVILRTAVEEKLSWAPLAIGLTVFVDILMGGPLTGAAMNPARAFGPAVLSGFWDSHWLYWVAPMTGAVFGWLFNKSCGEKPTVKT